MNQFTGILEVQTERLEIHRLSLRLLNQTNDAIVETLRVLTDHVNRGTSTPRVEAAHPRAESPDEAPLVPNPSPEVFDS